MLWTCSFVVTYLEVCFFSCIYVCLLQRFTVLFVPDNTCLEPCKLLVSHWLLGGSHCTNQWPTWLTLIQKTVNRSQDIQTCMSVCINLYKPIMYCNLVNPAMKYPPIARGIPVYPISETSIADGLLWFIIGFKPGYTVS